jgi:hypothetical protein
MAFADPQTFDMDGDTITLNRILDDGLKSIYQTADGKYVFTISHQVTKGRARRMVRIDHQLVIVDPLSTENTLQTLSAYFVLDEPSNPGLTDDEVLLFLWQGLAAWATDANIGKLTGSQH